MIPTATDHQIVSVTQDEGEIKFVNSCSTLWVTFYVDNVESGSVPPGDSQTTTASIGNHKLKATTVETNKRTIYQDINLQANGYVWTVSCN